MSAPAHVLAQQLADHVNDATLSDAAFREMVRRAVLDTAEVAPVAPGKVMVVGEGSDG